MAENPEAIYAYHDENGSEAYSILRFPNKEFRARMKDGRKSVPEDIRTLYHLPGVLSAIKDGRTIYLCEGEKDADAITKAGAVGTTNPFGARNWLPKYTGTLRGAHVIAVIDRDDAGIERAKLLKRELRAVVKSLKFVESKEGKDAFDHLAAGHSLVDLVIIEQPPTVQLLSLSDLFSLEHSEPKWLVDGLLGEGTFNVLIAKPKVGKSTLCEMLVSCVAKGSEFLGRVVRPGRVVFLALEASIPHLKLSLAALALPADAPIHIATSRADCPDLDTLRDVILDYEPDLIIIDTLFRFANARDLNDYAEVNRQIVPIAELARETGITILATHHCKKGISDDSGDSTLGSTAIFGAVDTLIRLRKDSDGNRVLDTEQRYGQPFEPTRLKFEQVTRRVELGDTVEACIASQVEARILTALEKGPQSQADIKAAVKHKNWNSTLKELVNDGTVIQSGGGKAGDPFMYRIASEGLSSSHTTIEERERVKDLSALDWDDPDSLDPFSDAG